MLRDALATLKQKNIYICTYRNKDKVLRDALATLTHTGIHTLSMVARLIFIIIHLLLVKHDLAYYCMISYA